LFRFRVESLRASISISVEVVFFREGIPTVEEKGKGLIHDANEVKEKYYGYNYF